MVGRFRVQQDGAGEKSWEVFDAAMNGRRGSGLTEAEANTLAADLELQYDAYGQRSPKQVRKMDPPTPVEQAYGWAHAGFLEAWLWDPKAGHWWGRVRKGHRIEWIAQSELRAEDRF
jgi:hypothetical protein